MKYCIFGITFLIVLCLGCKKDNPTYPGNELPLGTVKGRVTGTLSTNFEYTGCTMVPQTGTYNALIDCNDSNHHLRFYFNDVDPDNMSNFPASLNVACNGEIVVIFDAYVGQSGSFTINGRREDHSIYGTFSLEAEDYNTDKTITINGSFNVPRTY